MVEILGRSFLLDRMHDRSSIGTTTPNSQVARHWCTVEERVSHVWEEKDKLTTTGEITVRRGEPRGAEAWGQPCWSCICGCVL